MTIYVCQDSLNYILKIGEFRYVMPQQRNDHKHTESLLPVKCCVRNMIR